MRFLKSQASKTHFVPAQRADIDHTWHKGKGFFFCWAQAVIHHSLQASTGLHTGQVLLGNSSPTDSRAFTSLRQLPPKREATASPHFPSGSGRFISQATGYRNGSCRVFSFLFEKLCLDVAERTIQVLLSLTAFKD